MKKILAIDDQKDNLTTIKAVLKNQIFDCKILTALSGKEGIDIAKREQPDTILLDIIMPNMDGYEVCRKLKTDELTKHIPIIMVTAIKTDVDSRVKGLELGADAFLSKPIDSIELSAQVNVMLRIKAAEDKLREEKESLEETVSERTNKLRESEEKFKSLMKQSPFVVEMYDLDGLQISVNTAYEELWGFPAKTTLNKFNVLKSKEVEDSGLIDYIKRAYAGESVSVPEYHFDSTGDTEAKGLGRERWLSTKVYPLKDNSDKVKNIVIVHQDVTERRLTGKKLRESEERFRQITENSQEWVWEVDAKGMYTFASPVMEDLLGYKPEEIVGKKHFYDLFIPEDRKEFKKAALEIFKQKQAFYEFENRNLCKDGSTVWLSSSGIPRLDDKGELIGYRGADVNITERKIAEKALGAQSKRLSDIIEGTNAGTWDWNIQTGELILNERWAEIMGYTLEELNPIDINTWINNVHPDDLPMANELLENHFSQKSAYYDVEFRQPHKDGSWVWVNARGKIVEWTKEGKPLRMSGTHLDITNRKRAEEALHLTQFSIDNSTDAVYWIKEDATFTYVNSAAIKSLGYSKEELLKLTVMDVDFDFTEDMWKAHWTELQKTKSFMIQSTYQRKDKSTFPVEVTVNLIQYGDQNINCVIAKDITERTYSEKVQKILFNISNAVLTTDNLENLIILIRKELGTIIDTKNYYVAFYDKTTDMISLPYMVDEKGTSEPFPAGKSMTAYVIKTKKTLLANASLQEKLIKEGKLEYVGPKNKIWLGVPLTIEGEIKGVLAVQSYTNEHAYNESDVEILEFMADQISLSIERKRTDGALRNSESKYRSLIQTTSEGFWLIDSNAITIEINESLCKMLGYKRDEILGKTPYDFVDSINHKIFHAQISIAGNEKQRSYEISIQNKKGDNIPTMFSATSVLDSDGKYAGSFAFVSNISERKEAEEEIITALKKAKESDRLKSAFLATMSHELRTPLNAIIGFSDIITEDLSMEEVISFNNTINSSGKHLLNIVEDLFDITLIESGEIKIIKEDFSLLKLLDEVDDVIAIEKQKTQKEYLSLKRNITSDYFNIILNTDPSKLKQIVINLLKNALKFTNVGEIQYGCAFEEINNQKMLKFFIQDTGIGVPNEKQRFIFDMFRQVDDTHTRVHGGTGIGLSISKKLVELLGGDIWLESTEGKGSTFFFTIPYKTTNGYITKNPLEDELTLSTDESKEVRTILVVEDVESSYEYLQIILRKSGYKTIWAKNGEESIKCCQENPDIDFILMDINMPVMNGYEATKEIKKFKPDLPIIAQTAYAIAGDREKAFAAGCDDYISKPINREKLIQKIDLLLNKIVLKN